MVKISTPENSLRKKISVRILTDHREICEPNVSLWAVCMSNLSKKESGWKVFLTVVLLLIVLTFFNPLDIPKFNLLSDTAKSIIDQRASNVATIISMTLTVIGLLLSNLATKESKVYEYLFVNSKIYLIIYYTLSVIFFLILVSTLKDTIPQSLYTRIVLAVSCLVLSIPLAIAFLFTSIIEFVNASKIQERFKELAIKEVKSNLQMWLYEKYSKEEVAKTMKKLEIEQSKIFATDLFRSRDDASPISKHIWDINLQNLEMLRKKVDPSIPLFYSNQIYINNETADYLNFVDQDSNSVLNIPWKGCLVLKRAGMQIYVNEYREYFDKKLTEYTAEKKWNKIEEVLDIYKEMYKLKMKHE